jgi:hypothetical protein
MGGSLHTLPTQAMVIRFGFDPSAAPQLTSTAGIGASMLPGFQDFFLMRSLLGMGVTPRGVKR